MFCSKCGNKLTAQTEVCPDCGHRLNGIASNLGGRSLNDIPYLSNKPRDFLVMLAGAGLVIILSLFNWATINMEILRWIGIPVNDAGLNIFSLRSFAANLNNLLVGWGEESIGGIVAVITIIMLALLVSWALMAVSCVKYKSNARPKFVYLGFGLSAIIPLLFIVAVSVINSALTREAGGFISSPISLTAVPYIMIAVAVGAIIYLKKFPAGATGGVAESKPD